MCYQVGNYQLAHMKTMGLLPPQLIHQIHSLQNSCIGGKSGYSTTDSMRQSPPWEANSHSVKKKSRLLWSPTIHYRVHNSSPLISMLRQLHPVHTFIPNFPKLHCNVILPSMPTSSKWSLPFKIVYEFLVAPMRAPCPAHLIKEYVRVRGSL